MKPLSERDENTSSNVWLKNKSPHGRNEATLWKRWEPRGSQVTQSTIRGPVGMKPLSERDENLVTGYVIYLLKDS